MAKRGLGRGLDALLNPETESNNNNVIQISVFDIDTNPKQPRKSFDEERLKELASSIEKHGIVQPVLVKKKGQRYIIIAGERRFRAARLLKMDTIPAIVSDIDEQKAAEVALIENIQREDLNPIEEAGAIKFLMEQHDLTQEEVSERIGKSRPQIANSLRLLKMNKEVQHLLIDGKLSFGHAKMLAGVEDKTEQLKLANRCVLEGWTVRALEEYLKQKPKTTKTAVKVKKVDAQLTEMTAKMREQLGAKVTISGTQSKGKIVISYYSKEDLENIYRGIFE